MVIVWPFFVIFVIFVRSAERERCVRILDGDDERCDVRDDGLGNEFRPSFTLNFTLNIFFLYSQIFLLIHNLIVCSMFLQSFSNFVLLSIKFNSFVEIKMQIFAAIWLSSVRKKKTSN